MNLWLIFLTGLTVGGLTCLAVQGGLLASLIASRESEETKVNKNKKTTILPTLVFLASKLLSHMVLGLSLGMFGKAVGINQQAQIIMQALAGFYMLLVALNLLNIHPIFRYAVLQPPRFLLKRIRNQSKSKEVFAPALLGGMTVFIPCGTTLAIEALAVSSANPFIGAAIMASFVLGTMPLFFGLGWITGFLGDNYRTIFLRITAVILIYLGITSINGSFIASGIPINSKTISEKVKSVINADQNNKYTKIPVTQNVDIIVTAGGYNPSYIKVRKGVPVNLRLIGMNNYSCASAFRIPAFNISKNLGPNEKFTVSFTPQNKGKIIYTCSMGMYSGVIDVI